jgi:hypothetical protein
LVFSFGSDQVFQSASFENNFSKFEELSLQGAVDPRLCSILEDRHIVPAFKIVSIITFRRALFLVFAVLYRIGVISN